LIPYEPSGWFGYAPGASTMYYSSGMSRNPFSDPRNFALLLVTVAWVSVCVGMTQRLRAIPRR
jgi:hypothetical protein